jgi:hypothetical protein
VAAESGGYRSALRQLLYQVGAYLPESLLDATLSDLSELSDAGMLALRPTPEGTVTDPRARWLLAALIAARWYSRRAEGRDSLLIPLQGEVLGRWLGLADPTVPRALLAVRGSEPPQATLLGVSAEGVPPYTTVRDGTATGAGIVQLRELQRCLEQALRGASGSATGVELARRNALRWGAARATNAQAATSAARTEHVRAVEALLLAGASAVPCVLAEVVWRRAEDDRSAETAPLTTPDGARIAFARVRLSAPLLVRPTG